MKNEIDFEMHSLCAISIIYPLYKWMGLESTNIEEIINVIIFIKTLMYCYILISKDRRQYPPLFVRMNYSLKSSSYYQASTSLYFVKYPSNLQNQKDVLKDYLSHRHNSTYS